MVTDGETGFLVPYDPRNTEQFAIDLAAAIEKVLADPKAAAAMGERGRQRAVESFGWAEIARRTVDVYAAASTR